MENYSENSLLGQLKENGIISNKTDGNYPNGFLPFGVLTGVGETSPFENSDELNETVFYEDEKPSVIMKKRLNELDAEFFSEGSFLNIQDSELTTVEKIKKLKSMIKKVDEKIFMLEDSDDDILLNKLKNEKETLQTALKLLSDEKSEFKTHINKNADIAIQKLENKIHLKEKFKKLGKFVFRICPKLHRNFLVRKALSKLVMLNENAKELMLKKIPYGESESRYNDFTACLSCANVIHAKLKKKI